MTFPYSGRRRLSQCAIGWVLLGLAMFAPVIATAQDTEDRGTVLVMGDSLSAAYGLAPAQGWVALTADRLRTERPGWTLANASVSGETTDGGASRIAGELERHRPAVVSPLMLALTMRQPGCVAAIRSRVSATQPSSEARP